MKTTTLPILALMVVGALPALAQQPAGKPEDTEVWTPVPKIVTPGATNTAAPSDAIVLFDGRDWREWVTSADTTKPAGWTVHEGIMTVYKKGGDIQTKRRFTNYQIHLEWQVPANSDYYPVLDLGTERTRYMRTRAEGFARLNAPRFDVGAAMSGRRVGLTRAPSVAHAVTRLFKVLARESDPSSAGVQRVSRAADGELARGARLSGRGRLP